MENSAILESKINLLETLFSHTFLDTTRENYLIRFKNSNVVDDMEKLEEFYTYLSNCTPTKQNKKDLNHLTTLIETYTFLILEYKKLNGIEHLPNNLKKSSLLDYLRKHINAPINIKEVLKELSASVKYDNIENEVTVTPSEIALKYALKREMKRKN